MISRPNPYLAYFVSHPVASNILMALAFLLGWYAYTQINVQLLPSYRVNMISIVVGWPQADAEAVERHIINPIEAELQGLTGIESVKSSSKSEVAELSNISAPPSTPFKIGYNLKVLTVGTVAVTITKAVINDDEKFPA